MTSPGTGSTLLIYLYGRSEDIRRQNIFILGWDDFNAAELSLVSDAENYRYEQLLTFDEIFSSEKPDVQDLLQKARSILDAYDEPIDGIIGYWDFPVTTMRACLCAEYNLAGPNLRGIIACEHKFWSRLEQSKAIDECPQFEAVDIFDEQAADKISIEYPFWLKPIKATGSQLGFKVQSREDFRNAQQQIQDGIRFYSENFSYFLEKVPRPKEVENIGGSYCIAESIIAGLQCTVSGYVRNNEIRIYGIVDSINYPESSSFFRFEYPSALPKHVKSRISEDSIRIIEQIGLDNSTFNIEFFYDETYNWLWALEVNPRLSQSHSYQYRLVDGDTNLKIMIDLALDRTPDFPHGEGKYDRAAKFFYRRFSDGLVTRVPDAGEIAEIEAAIPDTRIDIMVSTGIKLSELSLQDSYSYDLAHVFIAAADRDELLRKYHRCLEMMNIQIDEV